MCSQKRILIDVCVVTNRPQNLRSVMKQIHKSIPFNQIIIVDTVPTYVVDVKSINAHLTLAVPIEEGRIIVIRKPLAKLGAARQAGLEFSTSDFICFLDDDLLLEKGWFKKMMGEFNDPDIYAVSSKVIFGYKTDPVLEKLFRFSKGAQSGGSCIMRTREVLSMGGFDKTIHWGEDFELAQRIEREGHRWVMSDALSFHPMDVHGFFQRSKSWGAGLAMAYKRGTMISFRKTLVKRFLSTLIRPVHLALAVHPNLLIIYFLDRLIYFKAFAEELKR